MLMHRHPGVLPAAVFRGVGSRHARLHPAYAVNNTTFRTPPQSPKSAYHHRRTPAW
jgi:hypothetical protein